jgi:hypothetical protein
MAYQMHRVFCGTPGDLEEERQAFYEVMGELNQEEAMPRGILFVSVSMLPNAADKRAFQSAVSDNIRACRYYVMVLEDTWGPPENNYERDYALAQRCAADPELPMQDVAIIFKKPLLPQKVEPAIAALKSGNGAPEFETLGEFRGQLRAVLSAWLRTVPDPAPAA